MVSAMISLPRGRGKQVSFYILSLSLLRHISITFVLDTPFHHTHYRTHDLLPTNHDTTLIIISSIFFLCLIMFRLEHLQQDKDKERNKRASKLQNEHAHAVEKCTLSGKGNPQGPCHVSVDRYTPTSVLAANRRSLDQKSKIGMAGGLFYFIWAGRNFACIGVVTHGVGFCLFFLFSFSSGYRPV
jgi:hypothetical protein